MAKERKEPQQEKQAEEMDVSVLKQEGLLLGLPEDEAAIEERRQRREYREVLRAFEPRAKCPFCRDRLKFDNEVDVSTVSC